MSKKTDIGENRLIFGLHCISECKSIVESKRRGVFDPTWFNEISEITTDILNRLSVLEEEYKKDYFERYPVIEE